MFSKIKDIFKRKHKAEPNAKVQEFTNKVYLIQSELSDYFYDLQDKGSLIQIKPVLNYKNSKESWNKLSLADIKYLNDNIIELNACFEIHIKYNFNDDKNRYQYHDFLETLNDDINQLCIRMNSNENTLIDVELVKSESKIDENIPIGFDYYSESNLEFMENYMNRKQFQHRIGFNHLRNPYVLFEKDIPVWLILGIKTKPIICF